MGLINLVKIITICYHYKYDKYLQYAQAIRKEYSHLSDRDYQLGRKKFLIQFLAKTRIYYTDYFYQWLELTARNNLQTEINRLGDSHDNQIAP